MSVGLINYWVVMFLMMTGFLSSLQLDWGSVLRWICSADPEM